MRLTDAGSDSVPTDPPWIMEAIPESSVVWLISMDAPSPCREFLRIHTAEIGSIAQAHTTSTHVRVAWIAVIPMVDGTFIRTNDAGITEIGILSLSLVGLWPS